jgi:hypothetical protein
MIGWEWIACAAGIFVAGRRRAKRLAVPTREPFDATATKIAPAPLSIA